MKGCGELLESREDPRIKGVNELFIGLIRGMHGQLLRGDQPAASLGPLPVIVDMAVADPVILSEIGHVGSEVDPVGDHHRAYLQR